MTDNFLTEIVAKTRQTKLWLYKKLLVEEKKKWAVDTARHIYEDNITNRSKGE